MKKFFNVYKPKGSSPLDAVKKLKKKHSFLEDVKMAYAGRLDPMAEGVLLVVTGEELKYFDKYLKLDKEYEAKILFGFRTDTYDILGLPEKKKANLFEEEIRDTLLDFEGDFSFTIPPFSGYRIKGKPLFKWALENRMDEIDIPRKKVYINSIEVISIDQMPTIRLRAEILESLEKVKGNFRQEKIKKRWADLLQEKEDFFVVRAKISCSTGTYIRSLADEAGKTLESGAVLLDLKRTRVGDYKIEKSIKI